MKNTRRRSMKGGGCPCASGSLLGFPQSGGQNTNYAPPGVTGGPSNMNYAPPGVTGGPSNMNGSVGVSGVSYGSQPRRQASSMARRRATQSNTGTEYSEQSYTRPRMKQASVMARRMPREANITDKLSSIEQKLNSINADINSKSSAGLFGGSQKGGFLGLFENKPKEMPVQPTQAPAEINPMKNYTNTQQPMATNIRAPATNITPSAQDIVKMPAVTATNTGSANERIRNLEQRLSKMESKGGFSFFGGRRRRKTRKVNRKKRSSRK